MPKVTVVMPVYNGEKYLREAIDSILSQTFTDFEFIIINDGSKDSSLAIIRSYDDNRIRLIDNESNLGLIITRNKGLSHARGDFIAILDCDDVAYPTRISEQVAFLDANPDFGMIGSWVEVINEQSKSTGEIWRLWASEETIPAIMLFNNYFTQSAVMIRKSVLLDECYRLYPGTEDYDLWVRIARKSKVWNLQKVLVKYRIQPNSISSLNAGIIEGYVREIVSQQLKMMGLEVTLEELAIHRSIARLPSCPSSGFIEGADAWLRRIYQHNTKTRHFDSDCLKECLGGKWISVCRATGNLGLQAWRLVSCADLCRWAIPELLKRGYFGLKYGFNFTNMGKILKRLFFYRIERKS